MDRRDFLKAGVIAACGTAHSGFSVSARRVAIIGDQNDSHASGIAVTWALTQLQQALSNKGFTSTVIQSAAEAGNADLVVQLSGAELPFESVRLAPASVSGKVAVRVFAGDAQGFVYGLLELADRVSFIQDTKQAFALGGIIEEHAANKVRSAARLFVSEIEDKPWFYDKAFWRGYLDVLVRSRFNRFNLTFGLGYDFPRGVTGDYFHFPYPYLLDVPGYNVGVVPLSDGERDRNLETLQFIAAETAARGIQFQLGIWTHAYAWVDSPHSDHHIEGLTAATHAPYCRDALALLLQRCPQIQGITLRIHGESGIPEGSYQFWQTLFEAVAGCGRRVEIDMHAKGIDRKMIDLAVATGMPVKVAPKFSAEHMGLGYQQADIRELEWPRPDSNEQGTFALSSGSRRFLRYGYGDLFQEDRRFDVLFRVWPGTQHMLMWGDPATAGSYGRTGSFCGAAGIEICEPLTFKGREGSGIAGGRCAYLDESLSPQLNDWRKFEYTYRVWGRSLYNPDTDPEVWKRFLRHRVGPAAQPMYEALSNASRVLPLVTTAHLPSAANHSYWPELYTNMPMVASGPVPPYTDTPDPKCFATVSALDPQLFESALDCAESLLVGHYDGKYSPLDVAEWLETFTGRAAESLELARRQIASVDRTAFRQMEEDVLIYIGIGNFFAGKMRSAVFFELFSKTGSSEAGSLAVASLQKARDSWAKMANRAKGVYRPDITYGAAAHLRGSWIIRLAAIDSDLVSVRSAVASANTRTGETPRDASAVLRAIAQHNRPHVTCRHVPSLAFSPGMPLNLVLETNRIGAASLWYRHVNHAERWLSIPMQKAQGGFTASIPEVYTQSPFPLQYYFELRSYSSTASLYPPLNEQLSNQPYFVVWHRSAVLD